MVLDVLTVTDAFLEAIRAPHMLATQVIVRPPAGDAAVLLVNDGTVTIDRTADQRRSLDLVVADPLLYPTTPGDVLAPYGSEATVSRGVEYANGAQELAQLGVFRIESVSRSVPDQTVTVTAWDRSAQLVDQRFFAPRKFAEQTAIDLIQLLVGEVYDGDALPLVSFTVLTDDDTVIPKHHVDRDRWAEIQRVAKVIGCEAFFDEQGDFVIQDTPDPTTAVPVWTVNAGAGGVLIGTQDSVTREGAPNAVIALGETVSGNNPPVHSQTPHGRDLDALSPTYLFGAYGGVPRFYSSPHIRTQAQANRVADAQLADHLGITRTISFDAVVNPALDAGDAIIITHPDGTSEVHLIDSLTIPLSPGGVMTGQTRAVDWRAE